MANTGTIIAITTPDPSSARRATCTLTEEGNPHRNEEGNLYRNVEGNLYRNVKLVP
jgi:hypothetical protein